MYGRDVTEELFAKMKEYQEKFNDIVPLMMIPDMEEEELISKINLSIEEGKTIDHYIPEMGIFEDEDILT